MFSIIKRDRTENILFFFTVVRCGVLQDPLNGAIDCSDEDKYQSGCKYSCDGGYRLIGPKTRECELNRKWSGETPSCESICQY